MDLDHKSHKIQKKSFWKFLDKCKIEIPIIQRDYAQGREGKESLRERFLGSLKDALDNNSELKLDFVYGSETDCYLDNGKKVKLLQPLDGQQRLTTLWLLHWYIALRAGQLKEKENCEVLKRFTYETRISSREFCENLCDPENFKSFDGEGIVDFIKDQTWFYSAWKQDPTIQSMLRMLGGTEPGVGKEDVVDGIEKLFSKDGGKAGYWKELWERLTSKKAPIVFYYLPLEHFGLSDDLYTKMNARGKPLTPFENFKADLIGYIREQEYHWRQEKGDKNNPWNDLLNPKEGIPIKLDTDWMDIFWKIAHSDKSADVASDARKTDDIYLAFINRFFLNYKINSIEEEKNKYYSDLTDKKSDLEYDGLGRYKWKENEQDKNGKIDIDLFGDLRTILDKYYTYSPAQDELRCPWVKDFEFIPSSTSSGIDLVGRAVFYAICRYFKEGEADKKSLHRWMRVVWNIVSAYDIENLGMLKARIRIIDKIKQPHIVYEQLEELLDNEKSWDLDEKQEETLKEECIKACKILRDGETWEATIEEAERYAFFKGTIRFLYQREDGDKEEDWDNFNTKWKNAQIYFLEKPETHQIWVKNNSVDLLKALISLISSDDFESVLLNSQSFNNGDDSWIYYLLNQNICANIHQLLTLEVKDGRIPIKPRSCSKSFDEEPYEHTLYYLSQTQLLDMLVKVIPYSWIRWEDGSLVIRDKHSRKSSGQYVHLNTNKYDFLENEDVTKGEESNKIEGTKFHFENSYICFEYKSLPYIRWSDRFIYLQEAPGLPKESDGHLLKNCEANKKEDKYYCFDTRGLDETEIIRKLDELKSDYENDMKKAKADSSSSS